VAVQVVGLKQEASAGGEAARMPITAQVITTRALVVVVAAGAAAVIAVPAVVLVVNQGDEGVGRVADSNSQRVNVEWYPAVQPYSSTVAPAHIRVPGTRYQYRVPISYLVP
jgi:hypothetical protein